MKKHLIIPLGIIFFYTTKTVMGADSIDNSPQEETTIPAESKNECAPHINAPLASIGSHPASKTEELSRAVYLRQENETIILNNQAIEGLDEYFQKTTPSNHEELLSTELIKNPNGMRRYLMKNLPKHLGSVSQLEIQSQTKKNINTYYTFVNRNSDTLLVAGGGFACPREMNAPLIALFPHYDIVMIDHRGHGIDNTEKSTKNNFFGVDFRKSSLGKHEHKEVIQLIKTLKEANPRYKKILGVGFCFSATIFLKAYQKHPGIFDKLILDGAWDKGATLIQKFINDPVLYQDPQRRNPRGWKGAILNFFSKTSGRKELFGRFVDWLFGRTTTKNAVEALPALETTTDLPIMFFHGKNDLVVSMGAFNNVWKTKPGNKKIAIITDARHLQNHLKYSRLFAFCGRIFFEKDFAEATEIIKNRLYS